MDSYTSDAVKRLLQILAIFCIIVIWSMIFHKGSADVFALAQKFSGEKFWLAVAQYLIRNLAGG